MSDTKRKEHIKIALQTICSLGIENEWTDETPLNQIIKTLQNDGEPIMELINFDDPHEVIDELNQIGE